MITKGPKLLRVIRSFSVVGFVIGLVLLVPVACNGSNEISEKVLVNPSTATHSQPTSTSEPSKPAMLASATTVAPVTQPVSTRAADPVRAALGFDTNRFKGIPGIVDATNFGWPREIETSEGIVRLERPPSKVHPL